MIEVTEHRVVVPGLPPSLDGMCAVQLTDFHRSRFTSDRLLHRAVALTLARHPDLILLTGDYVTSNPADIAPCARILAPLRARYGVLAVLGNHDYTADGPAVNRALASQGFTLLHNRSVLLSCGLRVAGVDDDRYGRADVVRAFHSIKEQEPVLFLAHNPAMVEAAAERSCIAFSGHTHGGQVRVPFLTARKIQSIGAKQYHAGWFQVGKARLYVNRGLGQVGVPFRFFCKPEVACFTLLAPSAQPAESISRQ